MKNITIFAFILLLIYFSIETNLELNDLD